MVSSNTFIWPSQLLPPFLPQFALNPTVNPLQPPTPPLLQDSSEYLIAAVEMLTGRVQRLNKIWKLCQKSWKVVVEISSEIIHERVLEDFNFIGSGSLFEEDEEDKDKLTALPLT